MSINALLDDMIDKEQEKRKEDIVEKIKSVREFIDSYGISKWNILYVNFGDHLLKNRKMLYRGSDERFSVGEMKKLSGLNYGEYEFCYDHMAVVLSDIHHKYIDKLGSIIVAPISSTMKRNSVILEKKYNSYLENDSYVLLDNMQHISIERVDIRQTKRYLSKSGAFKVSKLSQKAIKDAKEQLKSIFGLS